MNAVAPIGYLDAFNPAQRRAVTHGVGGVAASPLLVIAGAGSGKTNTLAHRVAADRPSLVPQDKKLSVRVPTDFTV